MKSLSLILLALCVLAPSAVVAQTTGVPQTRTYTYGGAPVSIPLSGTGLSAVVEVLVPDNLVISNVTAQVQVTYPSVGELKAYLYSARGTRTVLVDENCGRLANINTTFDDAAQSKFSDFCPAEAGRGPFRANQPLANSKGENSAGYWGIVVQNTKSNSTPGTIQGFSVTITGVPITTPTFTSSSIVNSASGVGSVIAPGELVSIYGLALGPQTGVQGNPIIPGTSLGGTTVTINGNLVPILYSSYYQVNIQVPYSIAPGTAQIKVQGPSGVATTTSVDVIATAPGFFTAQNNGRGQILAVNQNGTVNSATNPVPAGSYIALYAGGLGAVTPTIFEGNIAPLRPLSTVNLPVSVVVGDLSAPVAYAGLAPGYIGLYQLNVQVPSTTAAGSVRVLLVMPNGFSSQSGAFIYVQ